ncbi:TIGR01244 family sulfur transferase [Phaeovulum sp.]|uniref:TIGR01244 family sulfur transferase n=1 Tax=Phaeovulum sp. TaxID=2934796 RepID=UPI00273051EA|nr:TIGR01244 family sulfur transferase [Phaeovulum sp.]MDP1667718.1 TIGR01244 family sulfur transferase [Phaeovulum sp.]MDZ4118391.1 TIGR01244 family sulfur transferase [Phaeovulum sp.]
MDLRQIVPGFAVAPQIEPAELASLAAMGFRTLINNRPDAEVGDDLGHAAMEVAARAAGLAYHRLPYVPGLMTPDLVEAFAATLAKAEGPVLAYCRSGTRSSYLWAMAQAPHLPLRDILAATTAAGYDLSGLVPLLAARSDG